MNPLLMLGEAASTGSGFDVSAGLQIAKTCVTWLFGVITDIPLLAGAFVCGLGIPIAMKVIKSTKKASK